MALMTSDEQKLLLKPREAPTRLSISERQLWANSRPRGPIPVTRIGNCVRYSPAALQAFIDDRGEREGGAA